MKFEKSLYEEKGDLYFNQERMEMLPYVPTGVSSVLDVGCSSGAFGKLIKERYSCEVWGVEPSDSAHLASKVLDHVYHDYFHSSIDFGAKKFDAIVFNDVLEHLINPLEALSLAKSLLNENGYVIASIPNVQCYSVIKMLIISGDWKYEKSGIMDKTHYRFFTKKSIVRLFSEAGFNITVIRGQNSILKNSRLLRILNLIFSKRIENFIYINYAIQAIKI